MTMHPSHARPLCSFPAGSRVTVTRLCSERGCRCRLCALGLTPGTPLQVVDSCGGGCRLRVRGAEVVLGREMASHVLARQTDAERP